MIVICKKGNKRLIKDVRYEVVGLWNDGSSPGYYEGTVSVKGCGRYVISNFTTTDGKELPKIKINPTAPSLSKLEFKDLKKGDILICKSNHYKTLIQGGMYKIERLDEVSKESINWQKQKYTHVDQYLKFEGISRRLLFHSWNFRKPTTEEAREMSLNKILNNEDAKIITTSNIRKIDMVVNKDLELMKVISKAILDNGRHHLSILEWACSKSGRDIGVDVSDFEPLMNMSLKDLLNHIDKK